MLDLEKVADRSAIDRSYDLRVALDTSRLRLCSQGIVSKNINPEIQIVERVIEKHHHHEQYHRDPKEGLDETRLIALMKQVIQEHSQTASSSPTTDNNKQILDAVVALQKQIQSIGGNNDNSDLMPSIDPAKLAELHGKAIDKMSEEIETGNKKSGRKVILKNTRLGDLADELD